MSAQNLWYALPVLAGSRVRLEPLAVEHAAGYLKAAGSGPDAEEVFRWLTPPAGMLTEPRTIGDARAYILDALAARARGSRFPYVQLDAVTGAVIGTTSFYEVDPAQQALSVGYTWLGQRWWRTGHNTESKLLMLTHAFETLGAVRVVWHTDILNTRSQAAIARLGAQREGVFHKHRRRRDGSWRDTVQFAMTDEGWPTARERLRSRLASGSGASD